jgi:Tfp pilus assembly protein PilF
VERIHNLLDLAISNSPSKDLYRYAKAYVLVELEEWSAARALLEELIAAGNKDRTLLTLLVRCARALNDGEAVAKYEKLLAEL